MFVRVAFRPGYPEAAERNQSFGAISQMGDAMTQDHPATQVHASLERARTSRSSSAPDQRVQRQRLDVLLRGANADSLVLAGISTSGVVLSTIRRRPTSTTASPCWPTPAPILTPRFHASDREGLPPPGLGHHHRRVDRHAVTAGQRSVR